MSTAVPPRARRPLAALGLLLLAASLASCAAAPPAGPATADPSAPPPRIVFEVAIDPSVRMEPFDGRVYVAFAPESSSREPRSAMHAWFDPPPLLAAEVRDLGPGTPVAVNRPEPAGRDRPLVLEMHAHPMAPWSLPAGTWRVQAVARVNPDSPKAGLGAGDLISEPFTVEVPEPWASRAEAEAAVAAGGDDEPRRVMLVLDDVVEEPPFAESERLRLHEMPSPALSSFLGRERLVRAAVILPEGHAEARAAGAEFPVIVWIGGFGSTHTSAAGMLRRGMADRGEVPAIWVVPDPSCFRGHSVFADSATNGPWGEMLVEELLPAIDTRFGGAGPEHRYVTGISSGGWSSLWLQVTYPEAFAGCWSHVPDPVDFRDFQMIDLYAGGSMYRDEAGEPRPLARRGGEVVLTYREFVAREEVLGPGGQIHAFEAVFSPRLPGGEPRPLFDRATGRIDVATAEAWRPYDIGHVLRTRWDELGPRLAGRLHVIGGSADAFYLEGAVELLAEDLERLGSDAEVLVIEGMGHTVHGPAVEDMLDTMAERWRRREAAADAGGAGGAGAAAGAAAGAR